MAFHEEPMAFHEEPLSLALGADFAAYAPPVRRFNPVAEYTKVWVTQPGSRSVVAKKTGQGKYGWDHRPELEASSKNPILRLNDPRPRAIIQQ